MPDTQGAQALTVDELKRNAQDWLSQHGLKVIKLPTEIKIDSSNAIWMIHEADLTDKHYKLRGYAAMVSTTGWFYYIEVSSLADYEDTISRSLR